MSCDTNVDAHIEAIRASWQDEANADPEEIQKDIVNAWKDLKQGLENHMDRL